MFSAGKTRAACLVLAILLAGCRAPASELWTEHCAECHGADGRGVEARRTFYPQVDLTRSQLIADNARGSIYRHIAFGWGTMPGFKHKLEQREMERLVDFAIELATRPSTLDPAQTMPARTVPAPSKPAPSKPAPDKPGEKP